MDRRILKMMVRGWISMAPVFLWASFLAWGKWFMPAERVEQIGNTPWFIAGVIGLALIPFFPAFKSIANVFGLLGGGMSAKEKQRILATGVAGKAVLKTIGESSQGTVTINDQPLLRLTFEITDGFRAPYVATVEKIIPRTDIPRFQPGATFDVRVDRNDPRKVVFVLDQ